MILHTKVTATPQRRGDPVPAPACRTTSTGMSSNATRSTIAACGSIPPSTNGKDYDNAFWNGREMVYGDGDLFRRFTVSIDVIGHELTQGVTGAEAELDYEGESGALNEHSSDVFGSLLKQWHRKQKAEEADWIIGARLFTPTVKGVGRRSMKAPGTAYDDPVLGKDPQPAHMTRLLPGPRRRRWRSTPKPSAFKASVTRRTASSKPTPERRFVRP